MADMIRLKSKLSSFRCTAEAAFLFERGIEKDSFIKKI